MESENNKDKICDNIPPRPHTSAETRRAKSFKDCGTVKLESRYIPRLLSKKLIPRKDAENRSKGPMVARHSISSSTSSSASNTSKPPTSHLPHHQRQRRSLRPTSPTYESAFKRHVVNTPNSPGPNPRRSALSTGSFNRKRTPGITPHYEALSKKIQRARKAKLYLLQQAGPNSFIIGGDSAELRHKVVIGLQHCSCGKGPQCIHLLFVMSRVFQLPDNDPLMLSKQLKNFEVEGLLKGYQDRLKSRIFTRASSESQLSSQANGDSGTDSDVAISMSANASKDETTCPICLNKLLEEGDVQLVTCSHCQNNLHMECMAIWYQQLVKKDKSKLKCPLCMTEWPTSDESRFDQVLVTKRVIAEQLSQEPVRSSDTPELQSQPRNPLSDIDANTLLPRAQAIPEEYRDRAGPWVAVFGEDLIGCLFMKTMWTVREAALKHLSREVVLQLSNTHQNSSLEQQSIENILNISSQILVLMIGDPVYKVYVAALRALLTMLSYASLPDVTNLQRSLKPVIQSIILKCADGNRKTNQLALSTLNEFAKGQSGELALGKELNNEGQPCLGGCLYILECAVSLSESELSQWQSVIGRLITIDSLLNEHSYIFEQADPETLQLSLIPVVNFSINAMSSAHRHSHHMRSRKLCKRVFLDSTRYLVSLTDMMKKIRDMLHKIVDLDLRNRLEKRLLETSVTAVRRQPSGKGGRMVTVRSHSALDRILPYNHTYRVGSPTPGPHRGGASPPNSPQHKHRHKVTRQLSFGLIYPDDNNDCDDDEGADITGSRNPASGLINSPLFCNRTDSYTEAVHEPAPDVIYTSSDEDIFDDGVDDDGVVDDDRPITITVPPPEDKGPDCPRSPCKLSRGRVVSGSKPVLQIHKPSHDEMRPVPQEPEIVVESDGVTVGLEPGKLPSKIPQSYDDVDGDTTSPRAQLDVNMNPVQAPGLLAAVQAPGLLAAAPTYNRDESIGFDVTLSSPSAAESHNVTEVVLEEEDHDDQDSIYASDESLLQSQSVSISLSEGDESDDRGSSAHSRGRLLLKHNNKVPFRKYKRGHARSRTDPVKVMLLDPTAEPVIVSPRYHSDPTVGESTTTTSSNDSTPRTPPLDASSPTGPSFSPTPENPEATEEDTLTAVEARESPVKFIQAVSFSSTPASHSSQRRVRPKTGIPTRRVPLRTSSIRSTSPISVASRLSPEKLAIVRPQPQTPPDSPLRGAQQPEPATYVTDVRVRRDAQRIEARAAAPTHAPNASLVKFLASSTSSSGDERRGGAMRCAESGAASRRVSPYEKPVSFKSEVRIFSPRDSPGRQPGGGEACKDEVELEEAIALARAMEISTVQPKLPHVPGLSQREMEETITIHVQPDNKNSDNTDGRRIQYLENVHWKRGMVLGNGGFCTCYQARDIKTGILMALKQISFCRNTSSEQEEACHEIVSEVRTMAGLNHPNIVRILGATQTGAHFNIFLEWMPAGSIAHLLDQYGPFSEPVVTNYTQQILMGLTYLHDAGVLHRDMKGANLFVDSTGKHLRIGDFGACARLASKMTGAGEFRGQLLGTFAFMAPEVLRGEHYGRACDVWSVGCVIIEMCTTKPPWNENGDMTNHLKLIFKIASANSAPPIPENLPPAIKDLMLRCLEPDSKDRPSSRELLSHPLFTRYNFHQPA